MNRYVYQERGTVRQSPSNKDHNRHTIQYRQTHTQSPPSSSLPHTTVRLLTFLVGDIVVMVRGWRMIRRLTGWTTHNRGEKNGSVQYSSSSSPLSLAEEGKERRDEMRMMRENEGREKKVYDF